MCNVEYTVEYGTRYVTNLFDDYYILFVYDFNSKIHYVLVNFYFQLPTYCKCNKCINAVNG